MRRLALLLLLIWCVLTVAGCAAPPPETDVAAVSEPVATDPSPATDTPPPSATATATATPTTTASSTPTPTATYTATATNMPTSTATPTPTLTPTDTPMPTNTPLPTSTPTPAATPTPTLPAGVWTCPESTEGAAYVGSINSDKYHHPGCRWALEIKDANRVCFADRAAAEGHGYVACRVCRP